MHEKQEKQLLKLLKETREHLMTYPRNELLMTEMFYDLYDLLAEILFDDKGKKLDNDIGVGV